MNIPIKTFFKMLISYLPEIIICTLIILIFMFIIILSG